MTATHAVNHLAAVTGVSLVVYAVWSMVLDPAKGPLPGRLLPLAVGLALSVVGSALFAWGAYRIYGDE